MHPKTILVLINCLMILTSTQCPKKITKEMMEKVTFDYRSIDENGLLRGVGVDYEFCIPADSVYEQAVKGIDPEIHILKNSKGRIGCKAHEWLCINSTLHPGWRQKLYSLAALPWVEKVDQTFYE